MKDITNHKKFFLIKIVIDKVENLDPSSKDAFEYLKSILNGLTSPSRDIILSCIPDKLSIKMKKYFELNPGYNSLEIEELVWKKLTLDPDIIPRFLASLDIEIRDLISTRDERSSALIIRKSALTRSAVVEKLKCTVSELNKWESAGLLPHLFTKKIKMDKSVNARCWALVDVEYAKTQVDSWRELYQIKKKKTI